MKLRHFAALAVALVPALALSLSKDAFAQTPVKIGIFGIIAEAGLFVAQERGYFKQEGLDVEFLPGMVGADSLPALATGRVDAVGGSFGPGNINAVKRGIRVKIVAGLSSYKPGWDSGFYLVRKDLIDSGKVKDWKDLKGLTLAVAQGRPNLGDYITLQVLKKGGLTLKDANIVEVPFTNIISGLKSGGLDAAHTAEPQSTLAVDNGAAVKWHAASEYLPHGMTVAMLQFGPSLLEQKPGVGEKLITALLRGARDYNDAFGPNGKGREEIVQILIKNTQVKNPAIYGRMGMSYIEPDGFLNVAVLNDQAKYFHEAGASDAIDVSTITDDRFTKAAAAKLGAYKP
jgi:NitT/TauT family transport system substrate-binding protein